MSTWEDVKAIGLALPGTEEGTSWGTPALKIGKKFWIRMRPEVDDPVLVVRIDPMEREFLLQAEPDTFFVTPHYDGYPAVLVRLAEIDPENLRELLTESWLYTAPAKLAAEYEAESGA